MKYIGSILLFTLLFLTLIKTQTIAQITRGAQLGEIYMSNDWYWDGYLMHRAVFRSIDNGEHVSIQYSSTNPPIGGEMMIGTLVGDADQGAIYNYGDNELWGSFDYGENWTNLHFFSVLGQFTSGCVPGELYRCCADVQGTIWRSIDYGNTLVEIIQDAKYVLEVGVSEGDVYGRDGNPGIGYNLYFSNNYGEEFITIPIDTSVAYYDIGGYHPIISRGTEPGEIYLVSWWLDSNYKIFHSVDTGYTWTEKYESEDINLYYWGVSYTAGREPGSFYVVRSTGDPTMSHLWLYIDYSDDYGETFTTYFHEMDSLYTKIPSMQEISIDVAANPNPSKTNTTFSFQLSDDFPNPFLNIYDSFGNLIKQFNIKGRNSQTWDGTGNRGNKIEEGLYLYNISSDNYHSQFNKLLIIH